MDGYETNGLSVLTGVLQSNYSLYMLRLAGRLPVCSKDSVVSDH